MAKAIQNTGGSRQPTKSPNDGKGFGLIPKKRTIQTVADDTANSN